MSNYSPFGVPAGKTTIAPGFQNPTVPGQGGPGFELKPADVPATPQTPAQPAAGLLVASGASGVVPQTQPLSVAPLQVVYENLPAAKKEQYDATYAAMFQAGNER
jgi:hypothetical protein